ncbi:MAG: 50S ribosome-binding GTPase, partial [Alistipes sp.]|nr:50S ribosome-binding GTPase [Alistipes sp.]
MTSDQETIVAPATAPGGAIAVIRLSGESAFRVCDRFFRGSAPLADATGYTVHFGRIMDGERIVDEVLATVFRAPHSYTGENSVEISCHGSAYIVSEILQLAQSAGARMAEPGEFTIRAYLAGKLDLSQAEAVADLIASSSQAAHTLAINQMRGGYSQALEALRTRLLELTSLLELELDFSEEDVEFADRHELQATLERIDCEIETLRSSFSLGNAIREGVPVAIAGAPNVGKSTLLNRLLQDDRALVSDIAG